MMVFLRYKKNLDPTLSITNSKCDSKVKVKAQMHRNHHKTKQFNCTEEKFDMYTKIKSVALYTRHDLFDIFKALMRNMVEEYTSKGFSVTYLTEKSKMSDEKIDGKKTLVYRN